MGEFRNDCCEPAPDCCRPQRCTNECCSSSSESGSGWGILILLIILYFLFCSNNDRGNGLFGGLF